MKRMAVLMLGLAVLVSSSGCYCWSPWYGGSSGYNPYGMGSCGPGGCGMQPGAAVPNGATFNPQGAYQSTYGTIQAGVPVAAPMAAVPYSGHPAMAFGPLETLPTY